MPPERDTTSTRGRVDRRTVLALLGSASIGVGGLSGVTSASDGTRSTTMNAVQRQKQQQQQQQGAQYSVVQGEQCFSVTPLSGEQSARELYDLRIPERYEGDNGATDPGTGPYYESFGTRDLQQENVSLAFLYDGPNGLSLVVVHDRPRSEAGGAVSLTFRDVPDGADWVVKDDLYVDPETGEETNFDTWEVDGTTHTVDWTWGNAHNDGGVLRLDAEEFAVTVEPSFNDAAALWGEHYAEDPITDWQFLSFPDGRENPERTSIARDEPVTVGAGACGDDGEIGAVLSALLDVKPGSDDARINSKSRGVIPVWVSELDDFDLDDLDIESLRFGAPRAVDEGNGATPRHDHPGDGDGEGGDGEDGDDEDGLKVHFPTSDTGFEDGDELAKLVGKLAGERDVAGSDAVTVFSPGAGPKGGGDDDGEDSDDDDGPGNGRGEGKGRGRNGNGGDDDDSGDDDGDEGDEDDD